MTTQHDSLQQTLPFCTMESYGNIPIYIISTDPILLIVESWAMIISCPVDLCEITVLQHYDVEDKSVRSSYSQILY